MSSLPALWSTPGGCSCQVAEIVLTPGVHRDFAYILGCPLSTVQHALIMFVAEHML